MTEIFYTLVGFLIALLIRWSIAYLPGPKQINNPNCKHCYGIGYDASGLSCTCTKETKHDQPT